VRFVADDQMTANSRYRALRFVLKGAVAGGLAAFSFAAASAADLTVTVEGIDGSKGSVSIGLFTDKAEWPRGKAAQKVTVPAAAGHVTYVFKDLAPARYAVNGFYDENNNGKMDYSLLGLPQEGYFFSNDVSPKLSIPAFDASAITVANDPVAITIHLQYWGGPPKR
jgi:uncharacterized protein (DUF2141 family)